MNTYLKNAGNPTRTMSNSDCLIALRNIVWRFVNNWINELAMATGELESKKTVNSIKKEEYEKNGDIGFGFKPSDLSYNNRRVDDAKRELEQFRQLLYFINETLDVSNSAKPMRPCATPKDSTQQADER
jgi:hypothetical protein